MMLVTELLAGGDLYSALKRDAGHGSRQLSWYRRCAPPPPPSMGTHEKRPSSLLT